jgi:myo-inositol-1(or 4)-monophosphatase
MHDSASLAREAARRGGRYVASLLGKSRVGNKGLAYDFVTDADRGAENLIKEFLLAEAPHCSFFGEETKGETDLNAERLWIVDPIDGTTNFVHQIPHFSVSVAYTEKGRLVAGAVYDPMRDELFAASAGNGAFLNEKRIRVSERDALSKSLIATGFYYDRSATMEKTLAALHTLFGKQIHCMRRMGACTLDLTWLACGRYDGYFEYTLSPWDFAAGLLIVLEAGGRASDIDGTPAGLFAKGLICSNGLIHDELLAVTLDPGRLGKCTANTLQ